jgi:UDP-N-acetylmuramoylalanine--D-glutamate ligase
VTGLDIGSVRFPTGPNRSLIPGLVPAPDISSAVSSGDIVLLAPGCASFGLFRDYRDRGDQFKAAIKGLKSES